MKYVLLILSITFLPPLFAQQLLQMPYGCLLEVHVIKVSPSSHFDFSIAMISPPPLIDDE